MIQVTEHTRNILLEIAKKNKIYVEGSFLKLLTAAPEDKEFADYLKLCREKDTANRRKRIEVAKEVQKQNKELILAAEENEHLAQELKEALETAQKAKQEAEKLRDEAVEDLDTLQKKSQFELIGKIVKVALAVIITVGFFVTGLFTITLLTNNNSAIVESTWSNLMGILLTNSFSIVGTIMGVKYATEK